MGRLGSGLIRNKQIKYSLTKYLYKTNTMTKKTLTVIAALACCVGMQAQTLEAETMTLGGSYAGTCSSPFPGVALYGNGDNATGVVSLTNGSGVYNIKVTGASNNSTAAGVALYVGGKKMADMSFSGTAPSVQLVQTKLYLDASSVDVKLNLENDNGSNDTYIDKIEFEFVKALAVRPTPVLPQQSVWQSGEYRNILLEAGYTQTEIDGKLQAIAHSFFEGDADNERLYYELGSDEAYILDTGNDDVRTESMSYGMMICVQLNKKAEFDKLWRFVKNRCMIKSGPNKGFLAWQINTDGSIKDQNAAPDGDEYIATALMFAAGRWGNDTGIDYWKEANYILQNMQSKGHYINSSHVNMFNKDEKQIVFVPYAQAAVYTDPSYHMPAFYELWSKWADTNRRFWKECADKSREMYPRFANSKTGLMPDYAEFSGEARAGEHCDFRYDAWRCAMHMATDYMWFNGSETEKQQIKKLLDFFYGEGIKDYKGLYQLNGTAIYGADHSPGLVGCNAVGAMISTENYAWDFIDDFYEMTFPTGRYRYYDGCLYFLSYLHASGNFKMYKPADVLSVALDEQYKKDASNYLVIDDFENVPEGKEFYMHCMDNSASAANLVADPKNGSNHVIGIEPKSYGEYYYQQFRLPEGQTLGGNYKSIEFDILFDGASYNNETLNVFLNDYSQAIYTESTGAKAEQTAWKHISVDVPAGNTDNEFVIGLGVRAGGGICYVDNLKLRPIGAGEPTPGPGNDTPTAGTNNGTYVTVGNDKFYIIEDFEDKTVGDAIEMENEGGTATVSDDHQMEGTKALKVNIASGYHSNGSYAIDVTLPENVTLSETAFSAIDFDIYFSAGSINWKGGEYDTGVKVWLNSSDNRIFAYDTQQCVGTGMKLTVPLDGYYTDSNSFRLLIGGLCSDDADGVYYIDNIRLVCSEQQSEDGPQPEKYSQDNLLPVGAWGFEDGQTNNWISWSDNYETTVDNSGYASRYCLKVTNQTATDNRWNKQTAYMLNSALTVGSTYTMTFKAKADVESQAGVTLTMGDNPWTAEREQAIDLTTDWAEYTYEVTITNEGVNRIIFNLGEAATSYYFDNICLVKKADDNPGGGQEGNDPIPGTDAKKVVLDNFEKYAVGDTPYTLENANGGSASVVSADADNKVLNFTTGSYKNGEYLALTFTLPQGKTLSDYDVLTFDYAFAASGNDNTWKDIKVCIDSKNTAVGTIATKNAPAEWQTMSIALENVQGGNSFTLYIGGINASVLSMNIDNIVIKTSDADDEEEETDIPTNINLQSISYGNALEMFNIGGQRVNGSYRGIVVINGKKLVVK